MKMSGVNKVILLGYVSAAPEITISGNEIAAINFTVNTFEKLQKNSQHQTHFEKHYLVMSGKIAASAAKMLKPERLTYFEGRVTTSHYTDQQGIRRYKTEIVAHHFEIF